MKEVKHPVRAAYARLLPIVNHLDNLQEYLAQADRQGAFHPKDVQRLLDKLSEIRNPLMDLEDMIRPFLEK
jgi:hypothetical protein